MKLKILFQTIFLFVMLFNLLQTQVLADDSQPVNITIEAAADRKQATIGDKINYLVTLTHPETIKISAPEKIFELGSWDVKDIKPSEEKKDKILSHFNYVLTVFSTGEVLIPEITFKYKDETNTEKEIKSAPSKITIESILAKTKDAKGIIDIKPPFTVKLPLSVYLIWAAVIIALLAGLYFWYSRYNKKKKALFPVSTEPQIPPYQLAMQRLESLKNSTMVKDGLIKEFYITLADIIRDYISAVYAVETRDRTTGEIYSELRQKEHDKKVLGMYKDFFDVCDFVKFAKYRPDEQTCWQDWESAKKLIE